MKINPDKLVVSKTVWICLGLTALLIALPIALGFSITYFPVVSFPVILLARRAGQQFRIDNGYADADETPDH